MWKSNINPIGDSSYLSFSATGLSQLEINDTITEHTIYSSNKPESLSGIDDVFFEISTLTTEETPAGEYEDRVHFTITANF